MTQRDPGHAPAARPDPSPDAPTVRWTPPSNNVVENGGSSTPAERVAPSRRASRLRWGIALLVTVLVVAVGAAAFVLLTAGQSAPSTVVGYAPRDSVAYGELRFDLPGDQRQKLGQFLSKFPGFQDQATLDIKLDDVYDRTIRAMTDGEQDWTTKIEPWFGGELGFSLGRLPMPDTGDDSPRAVLIATVKDSARARAWFDEATADIPKSTADHNGTQLVVLGEGDKQAAMAIHTDRVMLIGDEASVRAALDTGGKSDLATADGPFKQAFASTTGDGLGYVFFDLARYQAWIVEMMQSMPGASAMPATELLAQSMPDWVLLRAQARADSLAFEAVLPRVEALTASTENRLGTMAAAAPPGTLAFVEGHDLGASIQKSLDLVRQDPQAAEALRDVDEALLLLGGWEGVTGWIGDGAIAVARDGESVGGGVLLQPTDRVAADALIGRLRTLAELGGQGAGIEIREEDHNGTKIVVVELGGLVQLLPLLAGGALPPGAPLPEAGDLELAIASTDQVVVIAAGPAFVRRVLDAAGPGPSLADDARYAELIGRVGAENTALAWLDVAGIRDFVEGLAQSRPDELAAYERDIKPYVLPLDAVVQATVRDGELDRTTTLVTVK